MHLVTTARFHQNKRFIELETWKKRTDLISCLSNLPCFRSMPAGRLPTPVWMTWCTEMMISGVLALRLPLSSWTKTKRWAPYPYIPQPLKILFRNCSGLFQRSRYLPSVLSVHVEFILSEECILKECFLVIFRRRQHTHRRHFTTKWSRKQ